MKTVGNSVCIYVMGLIMLEAGVDFVEVEKAIFAKAGMKCDSRPVFVIGSPRTGSTLLYQLLIQCFDVPYISNFINKWFSETPAVGFSIQRHARTEIGVENSFGKTEGILGPSEGSAVMAHWFGGGHPSQLVSSNIRPEKTEHFLATFAAVGSIFNQRPLLIKNAWNCFRVESLATLLPEARFIWIRRDVAHAAESDLEARYLTKGSPDKWNSATPANIDKLRKLPPYQQVVENQYEFNRAIGEALTQVANERFQVVWYEDLLDDVQREFLRIGGFLGMELLQVVDQPSPRRSPRQVSSFESNNIKHYIDENMERFSSHCYRGVIDAFGK